MKIVKIVKTVKGFCFSLVFKAFRISQPAPGCEMLRNGPPGCGIISQISQIPQPISQIPQPCEMEAGVDFTGL